MFDKLSSTINLLILLKTQVTKKKMYVSEWTAQFH